MSVLSNAKIIFCHISNKDEYSDKYQIVVEITEEQAADAEEAGLNVKTKEFDGATQFQVTLKSKFSILHNVVGSDGATQVDLDGGELARGSNVNVQYELKPYVYGGKEGVSQFLIGLQILEAVTVKAKKEFGDISGNSDPDEDM